MRDMKNGYIYYDYHKKTEKEEIANTAWMSVFHWLYAVGVLFVIFVVFMIFFNIVEVDGASMLPTLQNSDKLLVYSLEYTPKQGDIVVVGAMNSNEQPLVKRVIATENQTVDVNYDTGKVFVDGVALNENYITDMTVAVDNEITYPYTVPENGVFLMGDNRNESRDSRNRGVQAIDDYRIVGKVVMRFFPFSDMKIYE